MAPTLEAILWYASLVLAAGHDPRLLDADAATALELLLEVYEPVGSA